MNYLENKNISKKLINIFENDDALFKEKDKNKKQLTLNKDLYCNSVSYASVILSGNRNNGWDFWTISNNKNKLSTIRKL
ncbi:hypothetical protein [Spiroplasma sp. SV19]|uniref:hypothetical protein n=1 Tax=Spiroplasma sp. SV19 TaxID=2570468 RepID=UPI0024B6B3AE|nr:hypothetical protein [Spiroplasma sp. SV19]WHQ37529.1 DUF4357 domain-containing protein [Spiroplasma sp. SV19]